MRAADVHAVRVVGSGDQVFILGHGLGGDQSHWDRVLPHLVTRGRVITYDLAGSGACDPSAYSAARHSSILGFADDLALICADLGIRGATFIGHSMSGMSGALASVADPGLFQRMILLCASARYLDDPVTGYVGGFSRAGLDDMLDAIQADFALWTAGFAPHVMGNPDRPELATEFTETLRQYPPDVAYTILTAAFTSDFRDYMTRVQIPTLVVQGIDDPAVPLPAAQWLANAIPQARLEVVDVLGHFPHVVDPGTVNAVVDGFLGASTG